MDVQPCGAGTSPVRVTAGWSLWLCRQSAVVRQEDGKKACQCLCLLRLCGGRGPSHAQVRGEGVVLGAGVPARCCGLRGLDELAF